MYCISHRGVTVNSPLRYQIHRWAPNLLVIRRFGLPPTELWVMCTLTGVSFHFKLPLSLWMSSGMIRKAGGQRVRISWAYSSGDHFLNSWELTVFISYGVCVDDVSKGSVTQWSQLFCKNFANTLMYWNALHTLTKKEKNQTKQRHLLKWEICWCEKCFYFITFKRKSEKLLLGQGRHQSGFLGLHLMPQSNPMSSK